MAKIELNSVTSGYNLSAINDNFQKIEDELKNKVMYVDEVSPMERPLDMNGMDILNADSIVAQQIQVGNAVITEGEFSSDSSAFLRSDLASTSSGKGAEMVAFKQAGTGAVGRTASDKMGDVVSVKDFGAVGNGVTDDTAAFVLAIAASAGKKLVAEGAFVIGTTTDLASNTIYDFTGATFIFKATNNGFRVKNKKGVKIFGGTYSPHSSVVTGTHPTGTYGSLDAFHFEDSTECELYFGRFSGFYGAVNFYNCSYCTASYNELTDNAGGIQLLASSSISSNYNCRGINFSHNRVLHSGDDGISFLIGDGFLGTISASKIIGNHVTKDVGAKGTVGQSSGIALIGEPTSTSNNIYDVVVSGNTGYYMHQGFIQATGVIRSTISSNSVDAYAQAGSSHAYKFGETGTGAYGVVDCTFDRNVATNPLTASKAFVVDGAVRCRLSNNFARVSIGGEGALRMDNSSSCLLDGNTLHNTLAFGIQLTATASSNRIVNNDVSVFSAAAIADNGSTNFKENNPGHVNRKVAQLGVSGTNTSVTVNHGVSVTSPSRLRVRVTPIENWFSSTKWWVSGYSSSQFTLNVSPAPGAGNTVFFEWEAYESES